MIFQSSLSKYSYTSLFRLVDLGLLFFSAQEPLIFENIFVRFGAIGCSSTLNSHDQARCTVSKNLAFFKYIYF